ncbi:hypothetical protein GCM10009715_13610 [Paeniglutamicibacter psychrophenolicus]|uniref:Short-subunit dehydrogenase-like oxidoreductase (DUF2520 family) n=1 Tax=Paeniglutamicibacter psychrophenolicus TaxID=257454 RepID=A0ABS4W8I2_9MICC|nr:DUF2520 domain-containing protein [Paeniglutamicibacter psychrophenolicus]MBP2372514.1 putative short-subunit dehydrogenase-like oxidoreductase (DUF2520 family) [Paeniglutamicibacter psychrophenolicus]
MRSTGKPGRLGVGVIGAGKVGAVLGAALRAAEHQIVGVHAVSDASLERAEMLLPGVPVLQIPEILRRAELVILAVPDDALADLVSGLAAAGHWQAGQLVLHTAGRYGTEVLAPATAVGAIGLAVHPAMTFTGMSMDLDRLADCVFGVSASNMVLPIAQALVVEMGGEPVVIAEEDRVKYHAALSHASNHLVTVAGQSAGILAGIGVEQPERMLSALMRASLENALASGEGALTGPVARGDVHTIAAHRAALSDPSITEDTREGYLAMSRATALRAHARGLISSQTLEGILAALGK